ncbi:MAG: Ni/Fe hydrogenase subunit alpha [Deltaproteobacteria bacterium]|nr:MAG: Ni/Fe hydrogenase subunit alpha [Deltaproteobacteria bacterium]
MKVDMNIDVHHLTRVEGHGNIHINVKKGKLVDARWAVVETPRFFEAMLRGMSCEMAPILTARICGICSIGHALASLRAIENALGIDIPVIAKKIRLLAKHGETLQSHFLHLFFLAAPDYLNVGSVIPLVQSNRAVVEIALRLKRLANDMCDILAGRTTHPVSLCVGGVSRPPNKEDLHKLREQISERIPDAERTVELFKTIQVPDFIRETEYVSLKGEENYPWIGGKLVSTDGVLKNENDYLAMTNEYKEDFSTSKFTRLSRKSVAVGALARLNNNYNFLKAKDIAEEFGIKPLNHNPFMNNIAQLVECVHVMIESLELLDELLDEPMDEISSEYDIKEGEGVGAVEVPRGILYHHYLINKKGLVEKANCIIPTTQNNANIHYDLAELVEQAVNNGKQDTEVKKLCEMLVRAYDPCISCSVH